MASKVDRRALFVDAKKELYRRDFRLFAQEQLTITGVEPGQMLHLGPFLDGQELLHAVVERQLRETGWVRVVFIKSRQLGGSTYTAGRAFWLASLNPGVSTLEIAHDEETARSVFEKCKLFYDRMGDDYRPMARRDNKSELVFENPDSRTRPIYPGLGSKMNFNHAKNVTAGTGTTRHFIHLTEAAKFRSDLCDLLESSLFPALHLVPGTWCINESTAFVGGDYFRECCERARSKKSEWRFVFAPWYIERSYRLPLAKGERLKLDDRELFIQRLAAKGQPKDGVPPITITSEQFKWRRMTIAGREDGENIFLQEYPTSYEEAWITRDLNVFATDKMYTLRSGLRDPDRFCEILPNGKFATLNRGAQHVSPNHNYFAIWKEPEPGHRYDIGVDTSVGIEGGDWSVAEVFDRDSHEQMAEFHYLMDGFDLAEKLYWIGVYFNMAQIGVEMASTGFAVNGGLQRLGYSNLYIWRHREKAFPTLSSFSGWKTQTDSKSYMLTIFRSLVNKQQLVIHSHLLWNEMSDYVRVPGADPRFDQYRGNLGHDDATMAAGITLVIGDDEAAGLSRAAVAEKTTDRKTLIALEMAKGGPAFRDDDDAGKVRSTVQKVKNSMQGWNY